MKCAFYILSFSMTLIACQSPSARPMIVKDQLSNRLNNQIILQQIKNDEIIRGTNDGSITMAPVIFEFDGKQLTQSEFQSLQLDTFFYVQKKFANRSPSTASKEAEKVTQHTYQGFSSTYFSAHQFTPSHFDIHFDENDLLFMSIAHPVKGKFHAYGFDKMTGKQGVTAYVDDSFDGDYSAGNQLINRNIDELRLFVTINDSLYMHDFKIEDFYTHDH